MSEKRSVNLCSNYILPLLGLNKWSFGSPDRFVSSYISEDDTYIVVECTRPYSTIITNHANHKLNFEKDGSYFAVFDVPQYYRDDIKRFREGKYSKFSESAKNLIRKKSGLSYKVPAINGGFKTALELLALDKHEELRKHWEQELQVKIDKDAELMSIPGEDNFYNLKLSNKLESAT